MTDKKQTEELNEAELDEVAGAGKHEYREHVSLTYGSARTSDGGKAQGNLASNSGVKRPTPKGMERVFEDE
ncbi:hypothetical protein [Sphingorhabdus sp. Alg231-15]|uniref:hypothetical protein n=1 Tax=Sphingorhabdus sp. Alg231-15 TaxID=1922222 RepID=UPI000D55EE65